MPRSIFIAALLLAACGATQETPTTTGTSAAPATTTTSIVTTTAPAGESTTTVAETTTTTVAGVLIEMTFTAGAVDGGGRVEVPLGETIVLRVTSDVAEEVHVHGYDLKLDLEPNVTGELVFVAAIPGVFEVELENARLPVLDLEVGG